MILWLVFFIHKKGRKNKATAATRPAAKRRKKTTQKDWDDTVRECMISRRLKGSLFFSRTMQNIWFPKDEEEESEEEVEEQEEEDVSGFVVGLYRPKCKRSNLRNTPQEEMHEAENGVGSENVKVRVAWNGGCCLCYWPLSH